MKRIEHEVARVGDKVTIKASWRDQMRQPVKVMITTEKVHSNSTYPLITGEAGAVSKTINGIAQIAWDLGWRPVGLGPVLARIVETYKEPKIEG